MERHVLWAEATAQMPVFPFAIVFRRKTNSRKYKPWIFLLKVLSGLQIFRFSNILFSKLCDQKNCYMKDVQYTNKLICPDSREGNRCAHATEDTQDLRGMKTTRCH